MSTPADPNAPSGPVDPPDAPADAPTDITTPLPPGSNVIGIVQLADAGGVRLAVVKAGSTAAVAVDPSVVVALSPNSPIPAGANVIGNVGISGALPSGNNNIGDVDIVTTPGLLTADVSIKAASTAAVAGDKALVVAQSPNTPLPAGSNVIGLVQIASGQSIEVRQAKTLKFAKIDNAAAAGDTDIIAAVASKRLKVFAISLQAKGTTDVKLKSPAGDITGAYTFNAREGMALSVSPPTFLFGTAAGDKLTLNSSNAISVVGFVSYWDDDAT